MLKVRLLAALAGAALTLPALAQTDAPVPRMGEGQQRFQAPPVAGPAITQPGAPGVATGAPAQTGQAQPLDQQARQPGQPGATAQAQQPGGIFITEQRLGQWRASQIIGTSVFGADGQDLGEIREVLIADDGRAEAVVIRVGGVLGLGGRLVAVPFGMVQWREVVTTGGVGTAETVRQSDGTFAITGGAPQRPLLPITRETIEQAPEFVYAGRGEIPRPQAEPGQVPPAAGTPQTMGGPLPAPQPGGGGTVTGRPPQ